MCKGSNNSQESTLIINQLRRRINNALFDLHEWKHYYRQNNRLDVSVKLEVAEERFNETLKALEEALSVIELPPVEKREDFTFQIITK